MTPHFESTVTAAQAAVAAEARHDSAQAVLAAAEGDADTIRRRILDLEGARNAIIVRRREGDHRDGDGAELALLDADKQGLQEVLAERDAAVAAARVPADAAAAALTTARFTLRRAEALAAEAALGEHANGLVEKLLQTGSP